MLRKLLFVSLIALPEIIFAQKMVKLSELQNIINEKGLVKVINFWATWCGPCVKELPLFEKLNQEDKNVKVILVSMDYDLDPDPTKVNKFVERKKLKSEVVILAEENPNNWIDKIDKEWSGAVPATLIVNSTLGKRKLIEGELREGELEKLIQEISK